VFWHTVHDGITHPSDSMSELITYISGWKGAHEVKERVKRQRDANEVLRLAGKPIKGIRPFGFELDRIAHREPEAQMIRDAVRALIADPEHRIYPIVKAWNESGVRTTRGKQWSYAGVQQVLKRPRNAALVEHGKGIIVIGDDGEPIKAAWESIISREDREAVCTILTNPGRRLVHTTEPRWLCSSLIHCGACGDVLRAGRGSDRKGYFPIYKCRTKLELRNDGQRHVSVKCEEIDRMVREEVISSYLVGPEAGAEASADQVNLSKLYARLGEVRQGLGDLADLVGTPGFDKARTAKRGAELATEESQLVEAIQAQVRRDANAAMLVEARKGLFPAAPERVSFDQAADARAQLEAAFDALSLEQRRTLVRATLDVTVYPGRDTASRVKIKHLIAPGLDDDSYSDNDEEAASA
jgi:site-specific DNA recombinase